MTNTWADRDAPLDNRVEALLAEFSDAELIAIALADWTPLTARGLPYPNYVDSGTGLRGVDGATAFPVGIALAATMRANLAEEYGAAVGAEARSSGFSVVLGPTLDLARDPRGGRVPEAFGEDPYLAGVIGAAHVRGLQGRHVIAQLKHFVAYNAETRRTGFGPAWQRSAATDIVIDPDVLERCYARPFRRAIEAGAWSLMGSYNRVNGSYACESRAVLDLPRSWGWQGFYCPDFVFAVRSPAAALAAGLDLPSLADASGRTAEMFDDPALPHDLARTITSRVLRALIGAGLVDHPLPAPGPPSTPTHRELARRVAASGMVVLANDGVLPLAPSRTIALIGPSGLDAIYTGGGAAAVTLDPERTITPLAGIGARVEVIAAQGSWGDALLPSIPSDAFALPDGSGQGVLVERVTPDGIETQIVDNIDLSLTEHDVRSSWPRHLRAALTAQRSGRHRLCLELAGRAVVRVDGAVVMAGSREASRFVDGPHYPLQAVVDLQAGRSVTIEIDYEYGPALLEPHMGWAPRLRLGWQQPDSLIEEAAHAAAQAETAIVLVNAASGESMDRTSLALPGDQDDLVRAVVRANPRTVVVLNTPGPVALPWLDDVAAVVAAWYPGETFGAALADALFGDEEPAGRLPVTFPHDVTDLGLPPHTDPAPTEVHYAEGEAIGYRAPGVVRHGALFPFGYGLGYGSSRHRVVSASVISGDLHIELSIANTGERARTHVAQAYGDVAPPLAPALVGVLAVHLVAGESTAATLVVPAREFDRRHGACSVRIATDSAADGDIVVVEVERGVPVSARHPQPIDKERP